MRNRVMSPILVPVALLACSCVTFAQTYGTKGYSPGAWKPDELPKGVSDPKPFNAHDLSGVWSLPTTQGYFERHSLNDKAVKIPPGTPEQFGESAFPPPMTAWGKAKFDSYKPNYGPRSVPPGQGNDPIGDCDPMGYPQDLFRAHLLPWEFLVLPDQVLQHMQFRDAWRIIWTDGRDLPKNPDPAWYGYSVGHWEGDTFVVKSNGYDDRTWLDLYGDPHSDQMVLEERFRRVDIDHLEHSMTLTDPKTYTQPWVGDKITWVRKKVAIFEQICAPSEESHFNDRIRDAAIGKSKP